MTTPGDYVSDFADVALLVSDLERSKNWYGDMLGWRELFSQAMPPVLGDLNGFAGRTGDIAMGEICGVRLEFVQMHTERPLKNWQRNDHYGIFLLSFRITDVAAVRARCATLGVEILREASIGQSRTVFVIDPDGQELALVGPDE